MRGDFNMIRFSVQDYLDVKNGKKVCPHPILTESLIDQDKTGKRWKCFICGQRFGNTIHHEINPDSRYVVLMSRDLMPKKYSHFRSLIEEIILEHKDHPNVDIVRLLREFDDKAALSVTNQKYTCFKKIKKK